MVDYIESIIYNYNFPFRLGNIKKWQWIFSNILYIFPCGTQVEVGNIFADISMFISIIENKFNIIDFCSMDEDQLILFLAGDDVK